jgi:serine/threonine-protein kinase
MEHSPSTEAIVMPVSFGRYKVCKLLGEGAMGRVYLAEDPVLDRKVAIKVIAIDKHTEQHTRDEYLHRFTIEARACARLNHPSIVAIFDAGEQDGVPWIAFEYIDGDQLEKMLHTPVRIPIDRILAVTLDITAALHHAHECGIIHRDIKPANILVDKRTSIAKLADFGVVKAPWVALTQDGSAVGSPGYMSPEQLGGTGTDARSDLFSLGIVIYQMLTGKHPFLRNTIPATIFATLHGDYQAITELRPETPPYINNVVTTLLATDRSLRFQTAAMLLHELRTGSRPHLPAAAFDKNALTGNNTRLHRISYVLQNIRKKSILPLNIPKRLHSWKTIIHKQIAALRYTGAAFIKKVSDPAMHPKRLLPFFVTVTALPLFVVLFTMSRANNDRTVLNELHQSGYSGDFRAIIDSCKTMIDSSHGAAVIAAAEKLSKTKRFAASGDLLLCRIALIEGRDNDAALHLSALCRRKDRQRAGKKELPALIEDCKRRFVRSKTDSSLTATLAACLFYDNTEYIVEWISRPDYWLRWNSVRIAGRLELPVDSVALYLLDLQHGGSVRTRTHAATRLGELGDTRAIGPLAKAADLGLRDPIVSYTADLVLNNYFNNRSKDTAVSGQSLNGTEQHQ